MFGFPEARKLANSQLARINELLRLVRRDANVDFGQLVNVADLFKQTEFAKNTDEPTLLRIAESLNDSAFKFGQSEYQSCHHFIDWLYGMLFGNFDAIVNEVLLVKASSEGSEYKFDWYEGPEDSIQTEDFQEAAQRFCSTVFNEHAFLKSDDWDSEISDRLKEESTIAARFCDQYLTSKTLVTKGVRRISAHSVELMEFPEKPAGKRPKRINDPDSPWRVWEQEVMRWCVENDCPTVDKAWTHIRPLVNCGINDRAELKSIFDRVKKLKS